MICEFRKNDETMQMREVSVEWVCMTRKKLDSRGEVARGSERKKGYNLKFEMTLNGVRSFVGGSRNHLRRWLRPPCMQKKTCTNHSKTGLMIMMIHNS